MMFKVNVVYAVFGGVSLATLLIFFAFNSGSEPILHATNTCAITNEQQNQILEALAKPHECSYPALHTKRLLPPGSLFDWTLALESPLPACELPGVELELPWTCTLDMFVFRNHGAHRQVLGVFQDIGQPEDWGQTPSGWEKNHPAENEPPSRASIGAFPVSCLHPPSACATGVCTAGPPQSDPLMKLKVYRMRNGRFGRGHF